MALSEHDKQHLSAEQQAQILDFTNQWHALDAEEKTATPERAAQIQQEKAKLHTSAETVRAGEGYLGGADGTEYNPFVQQQTVQATMPKVDTSAMVSAWKQNVPAVDQTKANQQALLNQWQNNAVQQSNNKIDYAVNQGVAELERAEADAQAQFKEQQESITRDEMQSRDNAALYAEARGDKGGIGEEQYASIMNTAAQNRLSVQQAQTKLSTDTQRQIADLRAQGQFEKADALLEISQNYLSQLVSLEQWAFDAGMTTAQFKASLDQWAANYEMAIAEFTTGVDQWNADFAFQKQQANIANNQWQLQFDYGKEQDKIVNQLNQDKFVQDKTEWETALEREDAALETEKQANAANALLSIGSTDLTEEQLKALGYSPEQAAAIAKAVNAEKQAAADAAQAELELEWAKVNKDDSTAATNALYKLATNSIPLEQATGWLVAEGFEPDEAKMIANAYENMLGGTKPEAGTEAVEETDVKITQAKDGQLNETTLAWARKVLAANANDVDYLIDSLVKRSFAQEDINAILLALGLE